MASRQEDHRLRLRRRRYDRHRLERRQKKRVRPVSLHEGRHGEAAGRRLPEIGVPHRLRAEALIVRLKFAEDGKILVDWSDGTVREFDAWNHANDDDIEKFVDPTYLAQARVTPERDAIVWPDGERFDAKTLYERSAVVGFEPSAKHLARGALR